MLGLCSGEHIGMSILLEDLILQEQELGEFSQVILFLNLVHMQNHWQEELDTLHVTGINKYSEIGIVSAAKMESGIQ